MQRVRIRVGTLRSDGMVRSHGKTKERKGGCPGIGLAPAEPVFVGTVVGAGCPPPSDSSPGQALGLQGLARSRAGGLARLA